ncbi:MAG: DUF222 domain-containing protein [Streptosporangiaceae bacterium]
MPASTQPPGNSPPETQAVLLAAFRASLTGHGSARTAWVLSDLGRPLLTADVFVPTAVRAPADAIELPDDTMPADATPADAASTDSAEDEEFIPPQEWCQTDEPAPGPGCPAEPATPAGDGWPAQDPDPDLDVGRLAGLDPLSDADWQALTGPPPPQPPRTQWPEGIIPPDGFLSPPPTTGGPGFGFGEGDPLDLAAAGVALAGFAEDAHTALAAIDDDCLIGVIRGWRRVTSWATARELAAAAELARRRPGDGLPGSGREYVADELAAALTLTVRAGGEVRDLAVQLDRVLPGTLAALAAGDIDLARAKVIVIGTAELTPAHAAAVEVAVLPEAPGQTTGQLRAAVAAAVRSADPAAERKQREAAERRAYVSCWSGQSGTGHLEGHDLPSAQTLAADARLTQIATAWKRHGAQGGLDLLRAHAYLALLLGTDIITPPPSLLPPGLRAPAATSGPYASASGGADPGSHTGARPGGTSGPGSPGAQFPAGAGGQQVPAGLRPAGPGPGLQAGAGLPPLAGTINVTVPLASLLGWADAPGEAGGYGPIDAGTARTLARAAAGHPASRWQFTVTSPEGYALYTGTARRRGGTGWMVTVQPVATGQCDHRSQEPGYRPSPALQRLIRTRTRTCCYPGCRRPATQCDLDHTVAYEDGGRTCECDLAPLCRRHHQLKQAQGWKLEQNSPGVMTWLTPAGRRYTTLPSQHPT